jgi:hypothetical protein
MNDENRFNFPEPLDAEPRRFTPLLAVAGVIGAVAVLAIIYLLFFSGGGGPRPSPTGSPPGTGTGTATGTPIGSGPADTPGPGQTPTPGPSASAADIADQLCADPRPPFDALTPTLIEGFRGYCIEAVETVLADGTVDPSGVTAAGWAFAGAAPGEAEPAGLSRLFLQVGDERRVRSYLVSHTDTGATVSEPTRVPRIEDDLLVFEWERPGG